MSFRPSRHNASHVGGSVTKQLDRKVENLVRDYYSKLPSNNNSNGKPIPNTNEAIDYVQAHDMALKRLKRNQVEKSVTKAMELITIEAGGAENEGAEEFDSDFEAFNEAVEKVYLFYFYLGGLWMFDYRMDTNYKESR
ncbi:hypothetical protein TWF481_004724 [Arthrobotrys musiformis]|uniref:Uncharacterized protein n=1 Tax=Arthrobotrys musiformis TaxID=47236 RepID=A0AAV9WMA3_9PEZI